MSIATAGVRLFEEPTKDRFLPMSELDSPTFARVSPPPRDDDAIARLAYSYWEDRMGNNAAGSAEEDWWRAERELGY